MNIARYALCPTCWYAGHFQYSGQQRWPPTVARLHGLPAVMNLWTCPNCHSTLSEAALLVAPTAYRFVWRTQRAQPVRINRSE